MSPNSLIAAASLVFALILGSYFVVSPIAKRETDLRLAKIGTSQTTIISATKQNTIATATTATSSQVQGGAVRN